MITAAEKFDKVPPWCRIDEKRSSYGVFSVGVSEGVFMATLDGEWMATEIYHAPQVNVRRIARLTRPLDSWEPAEDDPLPVEGWQARRCATGPGWFVAALGDNSIFSVSGAANKRFDTRRAAYVWAWTEAEAPAENGPIIEEDVGSVYSVSQRGSSMMIDGGGQTLIRIGHHVRDNAGNKWHVPVAFLVPQHTDGDGAKDGLSDDRGTLGWAAFDELCKTVDEVEQTAHATASTLGELVTQFATANERMDGLVARIGPVTDGKGRTLVQIDQETDAEIKRLWSIVNFGNEAVVKIYDRLDKLDRLIAAQVPPITPGRNDAAAANALATGVAAADEGWREMLVPVSFTHEDSLMWWMTPDRKAYTGDATDANSPWGTFDTTLARFVVVTDSRKDRPEYLQVRSKVAPPPNLAEWYKPGHVGDANKKVVAELDAACQAVPSTYRVGDDLAAWVRNLASAHDTALKVQEQLRQSLAKEAAEGDKWYAERCDLKKQLAAAQTAATAAEGRAATALRRATAAEQALADFRIQLGEVLK